MNVRITLEDAYKTSTYDQDKIMSPEETVARFRRRLQSAGLDILDHTERIDNGRLDIPVYFSVCGRDARNIIGNKKQMGKGASPAQAEASAIRELAERFSFFSFFRNHPHALDPGLEPHRRARGAGALRLVLRHQRIQRPIGGQLP